MLLVLHDGEDGMYGSDAYEDSMFEVGKVMSFAVDPVEAKYDGVHVVYYLKTWSRHWQARGNRISKVPLE